MKSLQIGISTCPNDTFCFHALLNGEITIPGLKLEFTLADVEQLNEGMLAGRFDVCKVSAHAALLAWDRVGALSSGWALGHGVGPVVLSAQPRHVLTPNSRVLAPGQWTTAHLLWKLFHDPPGQLEQCVFSEIMPALQRGAAELGVCIHEGRFTWEAAGLHLFEDLGVRWAEISHTPLPLGGIVARRELDPGLCLQVQQAIADSLAWAHAHRESALESMRRHAQEESDEVLWGHVELYVNAWTQALGKEGEAALALLSKLAGERGLIPSGGTLEVLA